MSSPPKTPLITPADRLGLTVTMAVICHALVVLGVTFAQEERPQPRYNTMDIILVQKTSANEEEADVLAQASLEGGGDTEQEVSPSTPLPPPFPDTQAQQAAPAPQPVPTPQTPAAEQQASTPVSETRELVAAEQPTKPVESRKKEQEQSKKAGATPRPSATALLTNSYKIAALSAEIKQKLEARAKRPKRKFISASTREYKYAAYMEAWRAKVERVGNLNYPDEARKRKLSGSLILDVALNPDGAIQQITIRRSSGHKVLDDAAIRIVRLAAPFAPFPDTIAGETDILHITRTWQFLNNRGFR